MKKSFSVLPLLFFSTMIFAQQSKFSAGLEFTPTISTLSGNDLVNTYDALPSYSAGLTAEFNMSNHFSLRSGIAFERKGAKTVLNFTDVNGESLLDLEVQINYDYLVLPLLGTYSTGGRTSVYFGAGPYLGLLLSQKNIIAASDRFAKKVEDYTEFAKKIDYGFSLSFGVKIPLSKQFLFDIGPRANIGLRNTSKLPLINEDSVRVNSWGLAIGIKNR